MLPRDALRDILSQDLSNTDKILVCLAVDSEKAKAIKDIVTLAFSSGLRAVKKWNVSNILSRSPKLAARTADGWTLTSAGSEHVATVAGPLVASPIPRVAGSLRVHLSRIAAMDTQRFVEEAVCCFEVRQYRAATVLAWVGAVSLLYDAVLVKHLSAFNAEAASRYAGTKQPWTAAKTRDDLAKLKESEFLLLLEKCSIIGKSIRAELEKCLTLRNGCGHPNSLKIADHAVASHIEILILNVYSQF